MTQVILSQLNTHHHVEQYLRSILSGQTALYVYQYGNGQLQLFIFLQSHCAQVAFAILQLLAPFAVYTPVSAAGRESPDLNLVPVCIVPIISPEWHPIH